MDASSGLRKLRRRVSQMKGQTWGEQDPERAKAKRQASKRLQAQLRRKTNRARQKRAKR